MLKLGQQVVKHKVLILLIGMLLMIPSAIGYLNTRVNYDLLSYLPEEIDTMIGQNILKDEFGKGGFSFVILEGMPDKDVEKVKEKLEGVDHVAQVFWYDSLADISVPKEVCRKSIMISSIQMILQ